MIKYIYLRTHLQKYLIHTFGLLGVLLTFTLGMIALLKSMDNLSLFIPYGILIFILNLIYLKLIRLSRQDYEDKLKTEKEYSQELLKSQKFFLRYAVHETNTPLAVIMANIELFELEMGEHPVLSNIEAATKNIYGIYDDLSYLTQKDKVPYHKQEIVLNDFVQSRIEFFEIVAKQSGLSFEITYISSKPCVLINETKLQRIVDNNITNAIKYTQEGEAIKIKVYEDKEHYILKMSSLSIMIKEPEQIFNAYYRESKHKDGLGLGLQLVQNICKEEDIRIILESKDDITCFEYYFKKDT